MPSCGTRCGGKPTSVRKNPRVITENEGEVYLIDEEYPSHQTFKLFVESGETMRGVFYGEDKSSYVFLNRHENVEDIISTCVHEGLHAAIWTIVEWEYIEILNGYLIEKHSIKGNNNLKEHNAIRVMLMAEEYFGE